MATRGRGKCEGRGLARAILRLADNLFVDMFPDALQYGKSALSESLLFLRIHITLMQTQHLYGLFKLGGGA